MSSATPHPSPGPAYTGILRSWDAARGYGFIAPRDGGRELFVHASAFPRDGSQPVVGESLTFERGVGRDGRPQALRITRGAWAGPAPVRARPRRTPGRWRLAVLVVVLAASAGFGLQARRAAPAVDPADADGVLAPPATHAVPDAAAPAAASLPALFRCDGRTRCTQMTSCAKATWFLRHCPGTAMDGDHDGVPCEQQWCTGPGAR